jgi:hypothetical protein
MKYRIVVDIVRYDKRVVSDWLNDDCEKLLAFVDERIEDVGFLKLTVEGTTVYIPDTILRESIITLLTLEKKDEVV